MFRLCVSISVNGKYIRNTYLFETMILAVIPLAYSQFVKREEREKVRTLFLLLGYKEGRERRTKEKKIMMQEEEEREILLQILDGEIFRDFFESA